MVTALLELSNVEPRSDTNTVSFMDDIATMCHASAAPLNACDVLTVAATGQDPASLSGPAALVAAFGLLLEFVPQSDDGDKVRTRLAGLLPAGGTLLLSRVGCLSGRYESAFVDAVVGEARVQFLEQEHVQGECVLSGHVVVCFDSVLVAERPSGRDVCGKAASQREFVERSWRLGRLLRGNRPRYSCHARSDCHYLRQTISHVGTPCHPW
jgi:hypothetical protein